MQMGSWPRGLAAPKTGFDPSVITGDGAGTYKPPTGPVGWTRWGIDVAKYEQWQKPLEDRIRAVQAQLLADYGSQIPEAAGGLNVACNIAREGGFENILTPIGAITVFGVAFDPNAVLEGAKSGSAVAIGPYQPTTIQRWYVDLMIYVASQRALAQALGGSLASDSDVYLDLVKPDRGIQALANRSGASIADIVNRFPVFTTELVGYGMNPIAPTDAELTQPGGLAAYYARGGFLLGIPLGEGREPISAVPVAITSGYTLCGGTPAAVTQAIGGRKWDVFATVDPAGYTLRIKLREGSLASQALSKIVSAVKAIADTLCANQAMIQSVNQNVLLAELCHDTAMNKCQKGTTGCYCIKPTSIEQDAVTTANVAVGLWCGQWQAPQSGPPTGYNPFQPPPPVEEKKPLPWAWIAAGVAALGVAVYFLTAPPKSAQKRLTA